MSGFVRAMDMEAEDREQRAELLRRERDRVAKECIAELQAMADACDAKTIENRDANRHTEAEMWEFRGTGFVRAIAKIERKYNLDAAICAREEQAAEEPKEASRETSPELMKALGTLLKGSPKRSKTGS